MKCIILSLRWLFNSDLINENQVYQKAPYAEFWPNWKVRSRKTWCYSDPTADPLLGFALLKLDQSEVKRISPFLLSQAQSCRLVKTRMDMPLRVLATERVSFSEEKNGFFRVCDLIEFWWLIDKVDPGIFYFPQRVSGHRWLYGLFSGSIPLKALTRG